MAVKKNEKGKVLMNHEGFSVRQVPTYEGYGNDKRMTKSTIALFVGKRQIIDGFKNPATAIEFIDENLEYYSKKDKKFNIPEKKNEESE
ncbi:hypothetical protein KY321_01325 [Candidatus Woesearchaeota archaeon]|nr:hypothetical protein [Candidatus Woesearchaeota archaeon]